MIVPMLSSKERTDTSCEVIGFMPFSASLGWMIVMRCVLNGYDIEALPVYPANLNDWTGAFNIRPNENDNPGWRYYEVFARTGSTQSSVKYRFYNAAYYGQKDCQNDVIRLGWVNSRGGWDYFNFIKKSEMNDEISELRRTVLKMKGII